MLSKTALHALAATIALAEAPPGSHMGAAELAAATGAPPNYLGKLLKTLADCGLLVSQKGKGGGFRLARDAATISLFDLIEPIDHVGRWNGCFMGRGRCSDTEPCAVHDRWNQVRTQYLHFLQDTTLASLARRPELLAECR